MRDFAASGKRAPPRCHALDVAAQFYFFRKKLISGCAVLRTLIRKTSCIGGDKLERGFLSDGHTTSRLYPNAILGSAKIVGHRASIRERISSKGKREFVDRNRQRQARSHLPIQFHAPGLSRNWEIENSTSTGDAITTPVRGSGSLFTLAELRPKESDGVMALLKIPMLETRYVQLPEPVRQKLSPDKAKQLIKIVPIQFRE